jgi:toxin CcdB
MARFDVYQNPIAEQRKSVPYWLDIQSDFLESLQTRVVLPLRLRTDESLATQRLNPCFEIEDRMVFAETQNLTAVPRRLLRKHITSLRPQETQLEDALDFLFRGY